MPRWFGPCGLGVAIAGGALLSAPAANRTAPPAASFTWAPLPNPPPAQTGFTLLCARSIGIDGTNQLSPARYGARRNLMNGAGVALADFDGDGWCDIFVCHKQGGSALYRNLGGWRFTNITAQAGVALPHLVATGAVAADVNGDGWPDLYVTSFLGPDALLINLGNGRFTNVTAAAGLITSGGNTSAAFADLDGDGDLDLYLGRFGIEAIRGDGARLVFRTVGGRPQVTGPNAHRLRIEKGQLIELGEADIVFLNDGQGRFTPAPWNVHFLDEDGRPMASAPQDFTLAVQIRDFNGDGNPDIYTCGDFQTPDRLWLGDGRGTFRAIPRLALRNMSYASMGIDAADLDRDGHLDFVVVEMLSRDHTRHAAQASPMEPVVRPPGDFLARPEFPRNTLQWNRGDGTYAEIAWFSGVAMSDWSWTPIFLDVDLDGFEDLLVSNGHPHDLNDLDINARRANEPARRAQETARNILLDYPPLTPPNAAWRNLGNLRFANHSQAWRFDSLRITHGMALADLDNDGDLDLVANTWNDSPLIYRNDATAPRVAVRLRGIPPNTQGFGARVRLQGGPVPVQEQEVRSGARYLSSDQPQIAFATGTASHLEIEVLWRSGRHSRVAGVRPQRLYEIHEAGAQPQPQPQPAPAPPSLSQPLFHSLPLPSAFTHHESEFDDFVTQPLLPHRLSRLGPPLAWIARPQGGLLVLGGARGGTLAALRFDGGRPVPEPIPAPDPLPDDITSLLALELIPGRVSLFAGLARLETSDPDLPSVLRFDHHGSRWEPGPSLPAHPATTGPMATADLDGDGQPDLVVTGRFLPHHYPRPTDTRVFLNRDGQLVFDPVRSAPLREVGLVTGIALADFDGDGLVDLALACEWGPIRIFLQRGPTFVEATRERGLAPFHGLWQSLAAADLDGDGRIDLVAGNWGLNSAHQRSPDGPWELVFGDFTGSGATAIIEARFDATLQAMVPIRPRNRLARDLPWLPALFPSHREFARASVPDLLVPAKAPVHRLRATTLASAVFLNLPAGFLHRPLPDPAQWSPMMSVVAADLDGDGLPDLACAQNWFATRDEDDRLDAGRALLLRNRGDGTFTPLSAAESGLVVWGDQRAILTADLDADGHPDLVVSQNAGPPVAFRRTPVPSGP
ncbi:MAG: VCBS repeat-containing protein [Verrucomicrobiae bacterium]|nr:VCBS repeat-containing protein [Verrucomicrobiae bacterium]